jgi:hypothetical protein
VSAATNASALQAHLAGMLQLGGLGVVKPTEGSLAQRLGLVPGPPPPLTAAAWVEVSLQACRACHAAGRLESFCSPHTRLTPCSTQVHLQSRLRQDSHGDCAICLRPFKAEGQESNGSGGGSKCSMAAPPHLLHLASR